MNSVRFIITAVCIAAAAVTEAISLLGVFKFKDTLSRMHSAGIGDTLALFLLFLGLIVHAGFSMVSLKLVLALILFWLAAPVTSHMVARMIINDKNAERNDHTDQSNHTKG